MFYFSDIFKLPNEKSIESVEKGIIREGVMLFTRYFYVPHANIYTITPLPGKTENVSGTIVIPYNFIVNKYIDNDKKEAAMEFMKYISSKEVQKNIILKKSLPSAYMELYDDPEVCNSTEGFKECDLMKQIQPFSFMSNDVNKFADNNYHTNYKRYLFDYLYNDASLDDVLKKVEDLTKIYKLSLKTEETSIGLIIFIIFIILSSIMIFSLKFPFTKKLEKRFQFLSKKLWVLTILGSLMLLGSVITLYIDVTNTTCHLRNALINLGFILSISPSIVMLIINFPEKNKISSFFERNKLITIFLIMLFTVGLNEIFAMSPYKVLELSETEGKRFRVCYKRSKFLSVFYYVIKLYEFFIIFIALGLIFLEWNLEKTRLDVKYLATALFMDVLSLIISIIIEYVKFKNYFMYNVMIAANIFIFAVFNYLFIYLVRILPMFRPNDKYEDSRKLLGKLANTNRLESRKRSVPGTSNSKSFSNSSNRNPDLIITNSTSSLNNSKYNGIAKKLLDYHYQTSIITNNQKEEEENMSRNYSNPRNMSKNNQNISNMAVRYTSQSNLSMKYQNQSNMSIDYQNQSNMSMDHYSNQSKSRDYPNQSSMSMDYYQNKGNKSKDNINQSNMFMDYYSNQSKSRDYPNQSSMSRDYPNQSNMSMEYYKNQSSMSMDYQNHSNMSIDYYQNQSNKSRKYSNKSSMPRNYTNKSNMSMDYPNKSSMSRNYTNRSNRTQNYTNKSNRLMNYPNNSNMSLNYPNNSNISVDYQNQTL